MNLLFCISRAYLAPFLCCLKSIAANGGDEAYHIYVLHSFIDGAMTDAIRRDFKDSFTFHFIEVGESLIAMLPEGEWSQKERYYRFLAPFLLPEDLDRVLYLDADTVVINPLDELYHTPFEGNAIAGCTYTRGLLEKVNQARAQSDRPLLRLDPGVTLMNLPYLRKDRSMTEIIRCVQNKPRFAAPNQYLLSVLYGAKVKRLDIMRFALCDRILRIYNAEHKNGAIDLQWIRENAVIIHYCGRNKPWDAHYEGVLDVFYKERYA